MLKYKELSCDILNHFPNCESNYVIPAALRNHTSAFWTRLRLVEFWIFSHLVVLLTRVEWWLLLAMFLSSGWSDLLIYWTLHHPAGVIFWYIGLFSELWQHGKCRNRCTEMFRRNIVLKNFAKFWGKELCWGLLLKRDSGTGVFLWIVQNVWEQLFRRAPPNDC